MSDNTYSVLLLTAAPPGQAAEAGGAFVKIDGREAVLRSIELFLNRDNVKQILLAFQPEDVEEGKRKYGSHLMFSGVKLVTGGPRWSDQLASSVDKISPDCSHVIVHDAARPAVPYTDIDALMEAASVKPAVALVTPSRTALVEVDEGGGALAIHRATQFMHLLTPQAYTREVFIDVAKSHHEIHASQLTLLKGSPLNTRCGGAGDATMMKAMLNMLPKAKIKGLDNPFQEAQW